MLYQLSPVQAASRSPRVVNTAPRRASTAGPVTSVAAEAKPRQLPRVSTTTLAAARRESPSSVRRPPVAHEPAAHRGSINRGPGPTSAVHMPIASLTSEWENADLRCMLEETSEP